LVHLAYYTKTQTQPNRALPQLQLFLLINQHKVLPYCQFTACSVTTTNFPYGTMSTACQMKAEGKHCTK